MNAKTIAIAFGVVYSLALLISAVYLSGGGHIFLFIQLSASPLGAGLIFWPVIAARLPNLSEGRNRQIVITLLSFHYIGIAFYLLKPNEYEIQFLSHFADNMFPSVLSWVNWLAFVFLLVYSIGQFTIWAYIITAGNKKKPIEHDNQQEQV